MVKTDGQHIYIAQDRALHIVDFTIADAEKIATVDIEVGAKDSSFMKIPLLSPHKFMREISMEPNTPSLTLPIAVILLKLDTYTWKDTKLLPD